MGGGYLSMAQINDRRGKRMVFINSPNPDFLEWLQSELITIEAQIERSEAHTETLRARFSERLKVWDMVLEHQQIVKDALG
jgi:GH35 family endo-1,4-beta-xylanase